MTWGDYACAVARTSRNWSLRPSIVLIQRLALVALIAAAPAFGEQSDNRNEGVDDSLLIKLMRAQTHAVEEYARCLEDGGSATPCDRPRPLQLPPIQEPSEDQGTHSEAMLDSAARVLKDAEIRAIKAHAKCMKMKQSERCGPSP